MVNLDLRNYRSTINEINIQKDTKYCSSDCNFRYQYPASSTNYYACIDDTSNNIINIPNITVTNQTFCEASQQAPVMFSNTKYWFDKMFITDVNQHLFNYKNDYGQGNGDLSMCSCMILHRDEYSKHYLLVYIPIEGKNSITPQSNSGIAGEIITTIVTDVSGTSSCVANGCAQGSLLSTQPLINLNNLILSKPYYYIKIGTVNFVIFSSLDPIYVSTTTLNKINSYFSSANNLTQSQINARNSSSLTDFGKILKSDSNPINSLGAAEDEIYINCQPTDEEGELLESGVSKVPLTDSGSPLDALNSLKPADFFKNNTFLSIIIGIIIMIVLIKGAEYLFKSGTKTFLDNL